MTAPEQTVAPSTSRRPLDQEIDVYGMTHPGKVRPTNQDHFLIGSLKRHMDIHLTSLPDVRSFSSSVERVATYCDRRPARYATLFEDVFVGLYPALRESLGRLAAFRHAAEARPEDD